MHDIELDGEEREWSAYFASRDDRTAIPLMRRYAGLVQVQVHRLIPAVMTAGPSVEPADLLAVGQYALLNAIRRFDPANGAPFAAYASTRIHSSMVDELRRHSTLTRADRAFVRRHDIAEAELRRRLGRLPTLAELAECLGESAEMLERRRARVFSRAVESLDSHLSGDDQDWFADPAEDMSTQVVDGMERTEVRRLVDTIAHDRARLVVQRLFFDDKTQAEVADELGVSRQRVGQLLAAGLDLLRIKVVEGFAAD